MGRIIEILVILILPASIGFYFGSKNANAAPEPQIIYKTVYKDKIVRVPKFVKVPVEKIVYRDKSIEEPLPIYTDTSGIIYRDKPVEKIIYKDKIVYRDNPSKSSGIMIKPLPNCDAFTAIHFAERFVGRLDSATRDKIHKQLRQPANVALYLGIR